MSRFNNERVNGFLHTDGMKIVNGNGEEIILCGYGCGNWTNPEGFMVGAPTEIKLLGDIFSPGYIPPRRMDRRRTFDQTIRELCGSEYADAFWPQWHRNHLGEADIRAMAELGLNSVRLPINAAAFLKEEPGLQWIEDGFEMLDDVIDWCEKYKIYAILDMHSAPGGQSGTACDGGYDNTPHLFFDDESWARALALWEKLAIRYADRWIVGGYDLLNEPVNTPNFRQYVPKLAEFYDAAIAIIRKHDKNHMFTLEGAEFARSNSIFDRSYDPGYNNWCMHIHIYGASAEKKELFWYTLKAMELNVPIWIGEGGSSPIANAVFFDTAKDYGIGFNLWCWKTAMERPGMTRSVGYNLPKDWELIRGFASGKGKPSYAKAQEIFNELLENIKYENCTHNKETIRISKKIPNIMLPAVGYDNMPGDGKSYCGTWEHGNLLSYRLTDRTKLVLAPDQEEPLPTFDMFDYEGKQRPLNPLDALMIELAAGEFAVYTVYEVGDVFKASVQAMSKSGAEFEVTVCDGTTGKYSVHSNDLTWLETVDVNPGEERRIKIHVLSGVAQFKMLHIHEPGAQINRN